MAAIESVGAKAALGIAVVAATGASAVSREAALASKQAVLDAAQSLASDNLIGSAPTDASQAYAVIKAALDALEADPKANDMAKGLLSDANDSASSALLTYETAAQASASAQGSYSNALAQSEVANAGAEEFAKKRALADGAAINEALEAVLGAKNATAAAKAEALDAAADAFVNAQTAVTAAKTAVAQAYAFERAKAIEGDATEEIIAGVEAYVRGERDAPPTDLSAVPGFIMPLYDLQQSVISGSIKN